MFQQCFHGVFDCHALQADLPKEGEYQNHLPIARYPLEGNTNGE